MRKAKVFYSSRKLVRFPDGKLPACWTLTHVFVAAAAAAAKSLQSCPTLCDPIDGSPPGSPVPGIFQARKNTGVGCHFLLQVCSLIKCKPVNPKGNQP